MIYKKFEGGTKKDVSFVSDKNSITSISFKVNVINLTITQNYRWIWAVPVGYEKNPVSINNYR